MSDQWTTRPFSIPVRQYTKPSNRSVSSNAPAATPPTRCETLRMLDGTTSVNSFPHVSRCSVTHARSSSCVRSGRICISDIESGNRCVKPGKLAAGKGAGQRAEADIMSEPSPATGSNKEQQRKGHCYRPSSHRVSFAKAESSPEYRSTNPQPGPSDAYHHGTGCHNEH